MVGDSRAIASGPSGTSNRHVAGPLIVKHDRRGTQLRFGRVAARPQVGGAVKLASTGTDRGFGFLTVVHDTAGRRSTGSEVVARQIDPPATNSQ